MSRPLFSIVIPTYNRARSLVRAIRSCRRQTCRDFEIVVVDDGSSDDTQAVLEPWRGCIRYLRLSNGGAARARNVGIRHARGKYIALLDSDDEFLPTKLEICLAALEREPDQVCYSQVYIDRGVGRLWVKPGRGPGENEDIFDYLFVHKGWVPTPSVVLKADLARRFPYDERLAFGDDVQFAADLWAGGAGLRMIEQPLVLVDDRTANHKLSQTPIFRPSRLREHEDFIRWLQDQRPRMSRRAYAACRAFIVSRLVARSEPTTALRYILNGYREGVADGRTCLAQLVQTFAPVTYRRLANAVVHRRGLDAPQAVLALRSSLDAAPLPAQEPVR